MVDMALAQKQFQALTPQQQQQFLSQNKGNAQVQSLAQSKPMTTVTPPTTPPTTPTVTQPKLDASQLLGQVQADKQAGMTEQQLQTKYKSQYDQLLQQPKQTTTPTQVTPPTTPQTTVQPTVSKPTTSPQDKYIQDTLKKGEVPNVFGTRIMELEKSTPGITEKRNQMYIQELQAQGGLTSKNIDQKVRDLLKAKGIENFVTTSKDVENTVQSIASRLKPDLEKMERTNSLIMQSTDKVASDYFNGKISDTDLESIKLTDPAKYEEIKIANQKLEQSYISNQNIQVYSEILGDKKTTPQVTIPTPLQQIQEKMLSFFSNTNPTSEVFEQYKAELNNPELTKMQDELSESTRKLEDLDTTIKATADEVKAQYPGLSKSQLGALIQDRTDSLMKQRDSLVLDLKNTQNKITTRMDNAKDNYQLSLEQVKMERQNRLDQFDQLGTVYGMMKAEYDRQDKYNYAQFQADLELEQSFKKLDMQEKFLKGDVNSKDPEQVKKAVDYAVGQTLEEFSGLPISRSREKIVEDIQYGLKTGKYKSLGQAIDENLRKPIQGKPEYQQWSAKKAGIDMTPQLYDIGGAKYTWNGSSLVKANITDYTPYQETKNRPERQQSLTGMINAYGGGLDGTLSAVSSIPNGATGGECGEFANDISIANGGGKIFGNKLDEKPTNSTTPEKGSYVVIDNGTWTGHVGFVTNVGDNVITVTESNKDGKSNKVSTTSYSIGKNGQLIDQNGKKYGTVKGYLKPDYTKQTTTQNTQGLDALQPLYKKYMDTGVLPSQTTLKGLGLTPDQFTRQASSMQFSTKATPEQQETTQEIYGKLLELEKMSGLSSAVGAKGVSSLFGLKDTPIAGTSGADFVKKFDNFRDTLVLPNLGKLKGPMSDKDIAFLKSTATALDTDMSEKEFMKTLQDMKQKLEEKLGLGDQTQQTQEDTDDWSERRTQGQGIVLQTPTYTGSQQSYQQPVYGFSTQYSTWLEGL